MDAVISQQLCTMDITTSTISAEMPATAPTAVCHFTKLPNELQDAIFSFLGWELRAFTIHPHTRNSALRALWPLFCKENIAASQINDEAFVKSAMQHIKKPEIIMEAIKRNEDLTKGVTELSFAIPNRRLEEHSPQAFRHIAKCWSGSALWFVLSSLPVQKLHIITLAIPRRDGIDISYRSSKGPDYCIAEIPSSVRHFIIEEKIVNDSVSELAQLKSERVRDDLLAYQFSDTIQFVTNFRGIEYYHIITPHLSNSLRVSIIQCEALKELRVDMLEHARANNMFFLRSLFPLLKNLQHLRTLDMRWPYTSDFNPFRLGWAKAIPQVTTIRIPIMWFSRALRGTDRFDNIHFELLWDVDEAIQQYKHDADAQAAARVRSPQSRADKIALASQYTDFLRQRISVVEWTDECIQRLKTWFKAQRDRNLVEAGNVSIVDCCWADLDIGIGWFHEERGIQSLLATMESMMLA